MPELLHGRGVPHRALLLFTAQRYHASVFRHLRGAAGRRPYRGATLFALVEIFGALQHVFRFGEAVRRILLRSGRLCDHHRVARFQQIQWNVRLRLLRGQLLDRNVDRVLGAFQHIELRVDGLFESLGFLTNNIFRNYFIAGVPKFAETYRNLNKITRLNVKKLYIRDLFANLHQLMQPTFEQKNIELEILLRDTELAFEADHSLIEQVLINLIVNAIEAVKD